jgi:hypothetical protein
LKALILVCDCAGVAALVWLLNTVALIRFRRAKEAHWTVRARALARLYEDNLIPAVLPGRGRTHPDLYDRLLAVGVQPDFPRPTAPSSNTVHGVLLCVLLGILTVLTLNRLYP